MKLTESRLRRIIHEEISCLFLEREKREKIKGAEPGVSDVSPDEPEEVTTGDPADIAEKEFGEWVGKKTTTPERRSTLTKYWDNAGSRDYGTTQPWSAAFVSWAFKDDPEFKKSAAHSTYMKDAKKARDAGAESGYVAYKPEELPGGPQRNDVVCKPRMFSGDGWDKIGSKNHCDVFVGNNKMIGGNLSRTSKKVSYKPGKASMIITKRKVSIKKESLQRILKEEIRREYKITKLKNMISEVILLEYASLRDMILGGELVAAYQGEDESRE